jgi:hypothetical protein
MEKGNRSFFLMGGWMTVLYGIPKLSFSVKTILSSHMTIEAMAGQISRKQEKVIILFKYSQMICALSYKN